jgi:hypothetical protein
MAANSDRDEPVKIDLPPEEALRGLLAVDPESEPDEDDDTADGPCG